MKKAICECDVCGSQDALDNLGNQFVMYANFGGAFAPCLHCIDLCANCYAEHQAYLKKGVILIYVQEGEYKKIYRKRTDLMPNQVGAFSDVGKDGGAK